MLAISTSAAQAIKDIVTSSDVSDEGGLRITLEPIDEDTAKLDLAVTNAAEPGDALVKQEGANVFVEQTAADLLQGKILHASPQADGVEFSIIDAPAAFSSNGQSAG